MRPGDAQSPETEGFPAPLAVGRIARMEPRHELAVNALAWSCSSGPPFQQHLWDELNRVGSQGYVVLDDRLPDRAVLAPAPPAVIPLWRRERLIAYMQLSVRRRFVAIQHLVVTPPARRLGVASRLVRLAIGQTSRARPLVIVDVPDRTEFLPGQLFFSRLGFRGRPHPHDVRYLRFDWRRE